MPGHRMDLSQTISEKGSGISYEKGMENFLDHIGLRYGIGICVLYRSIDFGGGFTGDENGLPLWDWLGNKEW